MPPRDVSDRWIYPSEGYSRRYFSGLFNVAILLYSWDESAGQQSGRLRYGTPMTTGYYLNRMVIVIASIKRETIFIAEVMNLNIGSTPFPATDWKRGPGLLPGFSI